MILCNFRRLTQGLVTALGVEEKSAGGHNPILALPLPAQNIIAQTAGD